MELVKYDKAKIEEISHEVALAFMSEKGTYPLCLDMKNCEAYMKAVITMLVRNKCLYQLEDESGWIAYYRKKDAPDFLVQLQFATQVISNVSIEQYNKVTSHLKTWQTCEERFKHLKDYVSVFLVVVKRSKQGSGLFRGLMEIPFQIAVDHHIPCILDTDSKEKMQKYVHLGMELVASEDLGDGIEQYALIYNAGC